MFAKVILLLGFAALANSQYGYGGYGGGYGGYGGYGGNPGYIEPPQPYAFHYDAPSHDGGGHSQQESGDETGAKRGSYSLTHEGGTRTVNYVADAGGFRAVVETNEPGTANSAVGDAVYHSSAPGYGGIGGGPGRFGGRPY